MPAAAQHWQQTHRDQEKHWIGDISWWGFPAQLLPWTTAMGVVHGMCPCQSRALTTECLRCLLQQAELAAVSSLLQFLLLRSQKYWLDEAYWRSWHQEGEHFPAWDCQGAMQCGATPRTIPSTVWGTSVSEVQKTALQNIAQQGFQGYTLGFWHLISIYLMLHDLSLFCPFSFTVSRRAQRKLFKW